MDISNGILGSLVLTGIKNGYESLQTIPVWLETCAAIFASLELNQGDMKVQRKGATQFTLECVLEKIFNRTPREGEGATL